MSSTIEKNGDAMYDEGELPNLANNPDPLSTSVGRLRLSLVRENSDEPKLRRIPCKYPSTAVELIRPLIAPDEPQEVFGALLLDARYRPIGYTIPYRGTLGKAIVEARGVFAPALLRNAAAIIIFHNHPTGDPTPSRDDRELTRDFAKAGRILGIRLLDHMVLGEEGTYVSLREQGFWDSLEGLA